MLEAYRNMGKRLTVVVYGVSDVVLEVLKGPNASVGCLAAEAKEGNHGQPAQSTQYPSVPSQQPRIQGSAHANALQAAEDCQLLPCIRTPAATCD